MIWEEFLSYVNDSTDVQVRSTGDGQGLDVVQKSRALLFGKCLSPGCPKFVILVSSFYCCFKICKDTFFKNVPHGITQGNKTHIQLFTSRWLVQIHPSHHLPNYCGDLSISTSEGHRQHNLSATDTWMFFVLHSQWLLPINRGWSHALAGPAID